MIQNLFLSLTNYVHTVHIIKLRQYKKQSRPSVEASQSTHALSSQKDDYQANQQSKYLANFLSEDSFVSLPSCST